MHDVLPLPVLPPSGDLVPDAWQRVSELETLMTTVPERPVPAVHTFTPGLYSREVFMAANSLITSKIHKTEHQFVISQGEVSVWAADTGWVLLKAPFTGITKPGTRRVLLVHKDTIWTTFHPTQETDLAKIEAELICPHEIKPFSGEAL